MVAANLEDLFVRMNARCPASTALVRGAAPSRSLLDRPEQWPARADPLQWMTFVDLAGRLRESILVKVDRASMGVGLEVRCPLLDHRVVEFAARIPTSMKWANGQGKWLLRRVLDRYVPRALVERPKMGFGVPIGEWLRGPLRDWAEALLDARRLDEEGFLDAAAVRSIWTQHLTRRRDRRFLLWNLLVFQSWLEAARSASASP
jgi:asparagine synthase (glutamine-hydrolysing)